jgi:hypothetical protein
MINCKIFRRKGSWPSFMVLSQHVTGGSEENTKRFSHDRRFQGRDLFPGPPELNQES